MKLEELLPLTVKVVTPEENDETKAESKATDASEEGGEGELADAEEGTEKDGVGGKKKGTRKKRSLNWEEAERGLLLEVIKPKVDYVENRSVDAKSIKSKRLAWLQITKQFNALNFRHRALEQIQVQWRSMKNSAKREHQQKQPKSESLDGMRMIEFMEELQKEPVGGRSQTRSGGAIKKEHIDMDEDEDTPLAALPNSTNASEDTLQTSTMAIPSPPPSTAGGDSQQESSQQATPPRNRKKGPHSIGSKQNATTSGQPEVSNSGNRKRQRNQNSTQSIDAPTMSLNADASCAPQELQLSLTSALAVNNGSSAVANVINGSTVNTQSVTDDKYKRQLFELMKRARLAEMEYARREHEQKLRFEQMEQELKLKCYRQEQDLKLRLLRETHEIRLRQQDAEHEARIRAYSYNGNRQKCNMNAKLEHNDDPVAYK